MINETIRSIEDRVQSLPGLSDEKRAELTRLVGTLRTEVGELSKTRSGRAASIARYADLSLLEASHAEEDASPRLKELSIEGLSASVDGFEASHPRLVAIVNQICNTLANLGI